MIDRDGKGLGLQLRPLGNQKPPQLTDIRNGVRAFQRILAKELSQTSEEQDLVGQSLKRNVVGRRTGAK